jgi:hypothetical protein
MNKTQSVKFGLKSQFRTECGKFVSFRLVKFSSDLLGASRVYSNSSIILTDEAKRIVLSSWRWRHNDTWNVRHYFPTDTAWHLGRRKSAIEACRNCFSWRSARILLYIKLKWFFCSFLFVCLYLIQIYISEPVWTRLCTHLFPRQEETVEYVWSENVWLFSTFLTFFVGTECKILGTTWLPALDTSATALYPWFLRVLVWRHFLADDTCPESSTTALYLWFLQVLGSRHGNDVVADDTCPESSATALYPWFLQVLVWRHGNDFVAGDTCAFLLEVSCTVGNA